MKQVLDISIQICDILSQAHQRGATFLDHKLLHYYWNEYRQKVIMIDWNIGHWQPENMQPKCCSLTWCSSVPAPCITFSLAVRRRAR
jgi:hypothetical protein